MPRQLPIALSALGVMEHVMSAVYVYKDISSASYAVMHKMLNDFFSGRMDNPYFATNHPLFDRRLKEQQKRYAIEDSYKDHLLEAYIAILKKYPELMTKLLEWYELTPIESVLKSHLDKSSRENKALYIFIEYKEDLLNQAQQYPEFNNLLKEFNHLFTFEVTIASFFSNFWKYQHNYTIAKPIRFFVLAENLKIDSLAITFDRGKPIDKLMRDKYPFAADSILQISLFEDNAIVQDKPFRWTEVRKSRNDNQIQVYPADLDFQLSETQLEEILAAREITGCEMQNRTYFHLRLVPEMQVRLTLDYFRKNASKLADISTQIYMEANIFEPGLLMAELDSNPQFWQSFDTFITKGLSLFALNGTASRPIVFFIRLQYLVTVYAQTMHGTELQRLQFLQQYIAKMMQIEQQSMHSEILPSLHVYQFLTAIQRFKFSSEDSDYEELFNHALPSLFYLKAHKNEHAFWDASSQFELDVAQALFLKLLQKIDVQKLCSTIVPFVVENMHLGVLQEITCDQKTPNFCYIMCATEQGKKRYYLNIQRGLIGNEQGYSLSPIPLNIQNHPILSAHTKDDLTPCLVSANHRIYQLGTQLRFIRPFGSEKNYVTQKRWTIDAQEAWYELHPYSQELSAQIPALMQQRNNQLWLHCTDNTRAIITHKHWPIAICQIDQGRLTIQQLDLLAQSTGLVCSANPKFFQAIFQTFEAPEFMTIYVDGSQPSVVEINLGRYDITVVGNKFNNEWTYHLKNMPDFRLQQQPSDPLNHAARLSFIDIKTGQMLVYMPVQRFYATKEASPDSIFYQCTHDTKAIIAKAVIKDSEKFNELDIRWQWSGETYKVYKIDAQNNYIAETPAEALYLAYTYLASHHPQRAWEVLEDCATRLGGLLGTEEELKFLEWILNALPYLIDKKEDTNKKISAAAFVACQLKALSLFTSSYRPDKPIFIAKMSFDESLVDDFYRKSIWQSIVALDEQLNEKVYIFYTKYQKLQRYLTLNFQLSDAERVSLLDYYELQLHSQNEYSLGALAYERQALHLRALKREEKALLAKIKQSASTAPHSLLHRRLDEISKYLRDHAKIASHHTVVQKKKLSFQVPRYTWLFWSHFSGNYPDGVTKEDVKTWWLDLSIGIQAIKPNKIQAAIDLLTNEIVENEIIGYFPYYYALVTNPDYQDYKAQVVIFLEHYLLAHRHTLIKNQPTRTTYLLNILLRIANHFEKLNCIKERYGFHNLFEEAHTLPDPQLEIYEIAPLEGTILADTQEMWAALEMDVSIKTEMLIAAPCKQVEAFSLGALIDKCCFASQQLKDRVQGYIASYQKHAAFYGVAPSLSGEGEELDTDGLIYGPSEDNAGRQQQEALWGMKQTSFQLLQESAVRTELCKTAQAFIDDLQPIIDSLLQRALTLANNAELDGGLRLKKAIALETNHQQLLDKTALLRLYFHADSTEYQKATQLNLGQIQQLHTLISHYLACQVRMQNLQRFVDKMKLLQQDSLNPSQCQLAIQDLLAKDSVDYSSEPVLAGFQADQKILLRKQQKHVLKDLLSLPSDNHSTVTQQPIASCSKKSTVQKLIMGDGKSKVIGPIWAEEMADGTNLVVHEVPAALLYTGYGDLSSISQRLFHKKAYLSTFNRDSDCSPEVLHFTYDQFLKVIERRGYVVTIGEATQSRELKYLEFLLQPDTFFKTDQEYEVHEKQIQALEKLVVLFRARADVFIDEGHRSMRINNKLNYTLGDKFALPRHVINACVELYQFLECVPLDTLGPRFQEKTLDSVLLNNQLILEDSQWAQAMLLLTKELVDHRNSPLLLALSAVGKKCSTAELQQLSGYLLNKGQFIPPFILELDKKTRDIIGLYKQEVSELLANTLKRKLNAKYGSSHKRPHEGIAIPYIANDIPNERSKIGNPEETLNCTAQMLFIEGMRPAVLKEALKNFLAEARQELLKNPGLHSLDETETGKGFIAWIEQPDITLSSLDLEDPKSFHGIYQRLHRHKKLIGEVLKQCILPTLYVDASILHSDALNHIDMYRSAQVITGTPSNHTTYHQSLHYKKQNAIATDGFIVNLLRKKQTQLRAIDYSSPATILQGVFATQNLQRPIHAIIDVCAAFNGVGSQEVAQLICEYIRSHSGYFSQYQTSLQYVMFTNSSDILCAMCIQDNPKKRSWNQTAQFLECA